jgi:serine/threonine protein kinase
MSTKDDPAQSGSNKTAPGPAPALVSGGDLPPGYVVGEYRVGQVLGRGGMGVVYAGTQPVIEKSVAIKVLDLELSTDPSLVRRFLDEARAVNRIRHPNIIDIFSFGQLADGRQYFVMEYLEGRTLGERLQAGDLALADFPPLLAQICDALDAAHSESIVHRDLKPENIWIVEPKRGRPFVKLLDFGIAKLLSAGEQSTTQTGMVMGTPQYMSPEQCHGRAVDHRTDIYALGVILYQIWTGRLPFRGEVFVEILTKQLTQVPERPSTHATLPPALDELIMRCLAKEPEARPQSARELGEELSRIFSSKPPSVPTALLVPTPGKATVNTTLRSSAQGIEQAAATSSRGKKWPWVVALVSTAAVAAFVATRVADRDGGGANDTIAPVTTVSQPLPAPREQLAALPDAGSDARDVRAPADTYVPPKVEARGAGRASDEATSAPRAIPSPSKRQRTRASSSGLVTDNPFR